jgi:hypothetical protein
MEGPLRDGGISVIHREPIAVRRHTLADEFKPSTYERQQVRFGFPPSAVYAVFNFNRPQCRKSPVHEFVDRLEDIVVMFRLKRTDSVVICGYLNCIDASRVDGARDTCLTLHVSSPTFRRHCSPTARLVGRHTVNFKSRKTNAIDVAALKRALRYSTLYYGPTVTVDGFADQCADVVLHQFAPLRGW